MASFDIQWKQSAVKELRRLNKETIQKIHYAVETLSLNPHPVGSKKLTGSENSFRIRVGDYRIIYNVFSKILTIEVIRIGHRRQIYKR